MPEAVTDPDRFVSLSEQADVCRVKRLPSVVKLKLRTNKKLYTLKIDPERAEPIISKLKCELEEL